jgi:hypothetical protein
LNPIIEYLRIAAHEQENLQLASLMLAAANVIERQEIKIEEQENEIVQIPHNGFCS